MSEIEYLAASAYAKRVDPIEWGVGIVRDFIDLFLEINAARCANPDAFPGYGSDASPEHMARRALAGLLDAGWSPPSPEAVAEARAWVIAEHRRHGLNDEGSERSA
jgi:hypothetical protein